MPQATLQGATESWLGGLRLQNNGTIPCTLPEYPVLRALVGGRVIPAREVREPVIPFVDAARVRVLAPHASAEVIVQWRGCPSWMPPPGKRFRLSYRVSLPGASGSLPVPVRDPVTCSFVGTATTVTVTLFGQAD